MKEHIKTLRELADSMSTEKQMPIIDALDVAISVMGEQIESSTASVGPDLVYLRKSDRPKTLKFSDFIKTQKQLHGMTTEVVDWDKSFEKYQRLTGSISAFQILIEGTWSNRVINLHKYECIVVAEVYEGNKCLLWCHRELDSNNYSVHPTIIKAHLNSGKI